MWAPFIESDKFNQLPENQMAVRCSKTREFLKQLSLGWQKRLCKAAYNFQRSCHTLDSHLWLHTQWSERAGDRWEIHILPMGRNNEEYWGREYTSHTVSWVFCLVPYWISSHLSTKVSLEREWPPSLQCCKSISVYEAWGFLLKNNSFDNLQFNSEDTHVENRSRGIWSCIPRKYFY